MYNKVLNFLDTHGVMDYTGDYHRNNEDAKEKFGICA